MHTNIYVRVYKYVSKSYKTSVLCSKTDLCMLYYLHTYVIVIMLHNYVPT